MSDYTEFSTKLDLNIRNLQEALRQKNLQKALVEGCTAMRNLKMVLDWIHENDDDS